MGIPSQPCAGASSASHAGAYEPFMGICRNESKTRKGNGGVRFQVGETIIDRLARHSHCGEHHR